MTIDLSKRKPAPYSVAIGPLPTYDKCQSGGHGDGEDNEEDGEGAPGTAGAQLLPTRQRLQLTSAPAIITKNFYHL